MTNIHAKQGLQTVGGFGVRRPRAGRGPDGGDSKFQIDVVVLRIVVVLRFHGLGHRPLGLLVAGKIEFVLRRVVLDARFNVGHAADFPIEVFVGRAGDESVRQ